MKIGKLFSWAFWGGVALLVLYFIYASVMEQITLKKYGTYFAQARHPSGTTLLDPVSLGFSMYPATYIDDNIDFVPVYLVGQLRGYTGSWEDVESFYKQEPPLESGNHIIARPLVIDQDQSGSWLEIVDGIQYEPTDVAIVDELKDHYGLYGIPDDLKNQNQNVYLVYGLWWTSDR